MWMEVKFWTHTGRTKAKAFIKHVSIRYERKLRERRRSDTVVVYAVNDTDWGLSIKNGERTTGEFGVIQELGCFLIHSGACLMNLVGRTFREIMK